MIERGGGARLANEPLTRVLVGRGRRRQQLERDLAAEIGIFGEIDVSHPARAEFRPHLVAAEAGAGVIHPW